MKQIKKTGLILLSALVLIGCTKDKTEPKPIAAFIVTSEKDGFEVVVEVNGTKEVIQVKGQTYLQEVVVTDGSTYWLSGKANDQFQGIQVRVYKGQYLLNDLYRYGGREEVIIRGNF